MINLYDFRTIEEIARGVLTAVIAAASAAIYSQGVPTTRAAIASLLIGLIPVAYAALRAALNATPITPAELAAIAGFTAGTKGHA